MLVASSIVSARHQYESGTLSTVNITHENELFRMQLHRSALSTSPYIGGWDISFNEDASGQIPGHWQLQRYGLFYTDLAPKEVTEALLPYHSGGGLIFRPVRSNYVTDMGPALSYAFKSVFFRRVSYIATNGRRNTRRLPLRISQQRELAFFLASLTLSDRLFLHRFRRLGWRLVPTCTVSPVSETNEVEAQTCPKTSG